MLRRSVGARAGGDDQRRARGHGPALGAGRQARVAGADEGPRGQRVANEAGIRAAHGRDGGVRAEAAERVPAPDRPEAQRDAHRYPPEGCRRRQRRAQGYRRGYQKPGD